MNRFRGPTLQRQRSYWLTASNYYVLALAISAAVFFLLMGLLREGSEEPYIPAGVAASAVLIAAVIVRRAIVKRHQMQTYAARRLESNLLALRVPALPSENKLTLERNASILKELKRKSDAAIVLAKYSDGHREVFELCDRYLEINERNMITVNPGSPRIAALRRGKEIAEDFHRRHMLKWAELETTSMLESAQSSVKSSDKVQYANKALSIIDSASLKYPNERKLRESAAAIGDFIVKIKVGDLIERAGKAESRGNKKLAARHVRTALNEIDQSSLPSMERNSAIEHLNSELERLADSELK